MRKARTARAMAALPGRGLVGHLRRCRPAPAGSIDESWTVREALLHDGGVLDIRRLRVLKAVVDTGSVTAAAALLSYTPSAVSQQVAALEREAGTPLLDRVGRGVQPTPAGRLLAERAADLLDRLAAAEAELAALRAGRTGSLR